MQFTYEQKTANTYLFSGTTDDLTIANHFAENIKAYINSIPRSQGYVPVFLIHELNSNILKWDAAAQSAVSVGGSGGSHLEYQISFTLPEDQVQKFVLKHDCVLSNQASGMVSKLRSGTMSKLRSAGELAYDLLLARSHNGDKGQNAVVKPTPRKEDPEDLLDRTTWKDDDRVMQVSDWGKWTWYVGRDLRIYTDNMHACAQQYVNPEAFTDDRINAMISRGLENGGAKVLRAFLSPEGTLFKPKGESDA